VDEATGGEEVFAETLAQVTEGVRVSTRDSDRPVRRDRRPRNARFIRSAPKGLVAPG
jgi:hypothetical protein